MAEDILLEVARFRGDIWAEFCVYERKRELKLHLKKRMSLDIGSEHALLKTVRHSGRLRSVMETTNSDKGPEIGWVALLFSDCCYLLCQWVQIFLTNNRCTIRLSMQLHGCQPRESVDLFLLLSDLFTNVLLYCIGWYRLKPAPDRKVEKRVFPGLCSNI